MRCDYELLPIGPRCCRDAGHDGPHHYKCSGPHCPGLCYPAHFLAHPASCFEPSKADPPGLELLGVSDEEARAGLEVARLERQSDAELRRRREEMADAIESGDYELAGEDGPAWGEHAARAVALEAIERGTDDSFGAAADALAGAAVELGKRRDEEHRRRFTLGTRVKTLRGLSGVPIHTIGVVDEHRPGLVMVAWDLEDRPLAGPTMDGPRAYADAIRGGMRPRPQAAPGAPLRDGFSYGELVYLEVLPETEGGHA